MQFFSRVLNFSIKHNAEILTQALSSELGFELIEKLHSLPCPYLLFQPHLSPWIY